MGRLVRQVALVFAVVLAVTLGLGISPAVQRAIAPMPVPLAPVIVAPAGDLAGDEAATIALFEAARGSVASISTSVRSRNPFSTRGTDVPRGSGSGFVWDGDGHIVTNAHVLAGANAASVRLGGGRAFPAALVGVDRSHDLAVLRIEPVGVRALALGTSDDLLVGRKVFAIGNPFGLDFTLTTGIVSALDRELPGEGGVTIRGLIQTDAAINPGNSGGPLLDSSGRLIGVNTAIYSPTGASAGIGFAIPVDVVARVVPQLIATGRYAPPVLGVEGDPRADALLREAGGAPGVLVLGVVPGSPAAAAGLRGARMGDGGLVPGDVIEAVDGAAVAGIEDLRAALDLRAAGDAVVLRLRDGDASRDVTITLAPAAP